MLDGDLIAEANRQFSICNACRYCEGLCSVFPAMELRTAFTQGDVAYLSTLCHDCRACVDACPFSPPHEFAIDISALTSVARAETFEHFARPRAFWRVLARGSTVTGLTIATLVFFALVAAASGASAIFARHTGEGAFYEVITYLWILVPALVAGGATLAAVVAGGLAFARETRRDGRHSLLDLRAIAAATRNVLALTNLKGGGGGCRYPGQRRSPVRRYLHHAVFYGFFAMFASTVSAAIWQDFLGREPPYPFFSVPVLLGTGGGIATTVGCLGFVVIGARSRGSGKSSESHRLDRLFATTLLAATTTGLLLLAVRSTRLMGPALIVHLGVLGGLFLTFPYSKLVHAVYRYLALVRSHVEGNARTEHKPEVATDLVPLTQPAVTVVGERRFGDA